MDNQEYYNEFMQEVYAGAGAEKSFSEVKFTELLCDFLVEQAIIETYDLAFFKQKHQGIRIDAWDFNKEKQVLSLFISDFTPSPELMSLTQTDMESYFKRIEKFFLKAITKSFFQSLDESLPIYCVARDIAENVNSISKIRFFLLSNSILSSRFKGLGTRTIEGYKTIYDVWDVGRLARIAESGKAKEDILIDFTEYVPSGIQFLPASTGCSTCQSYLLVIPGEMLASIYDKYGERLLEQNVRTFLQFRGGVNKGIRNTIKNEPDMFFAYNNGLTVTAEDVTVSGVNMLSVKNLQIVNGAQTTASIFMTKLMEKKDVDLGKVYIQVKLSVIDSEKVDTVVPVISKCANTQNKVSAADFFSNHPFHRRIEGFSRRFYAPSQEGSLNETYWYYERVRGQYANKQSQMTSTQKRKFLIQNPKHQMFTKTDLAKFENSIDQKPHFVSKGAQWNFGKFAELIGGKNDNKGLWEKDEAQFNELYFKRLIAKAIMFKFLDKNIMKQEWYGGYKANIITYTLAKFAKIVAEENKFIPFMSIWNKQCLTKIFENQLIILAEFINDIIIDTDLNVTQYCKQEYCWQTIQKATFQLNSEVIDELVDSETANEVKKDARNKQKILNGIESQTYVFEKGANYWLQMLEWAYGSKALTEKDMSLLNVASKIPKKIPNEIQCKLIVTTEQRAIEEGFYL